MEKSYDKVAETCLSFRADKRLMVVSTGSTTKSPVGETRTLSLSKRPLWGKADDGGFDASMLRQAQPPQSPASETRTLSLSKRPL